MKNLLITILFLIKSDDYDYSTSYFYTRILGIFISIQVDRLTFSKLISIASATKVYVNGKLVEVLY